MWTEWWFLSISKRPGIHSSPLIGLATLPCPNMNSRDGGLENECHYTPLVATAPQHQGCGRAEWKNVCCFWYAADSTSVSRLLNLAHSYASDSLIWNVKLALKSWLQPVLECVSFSWFWQELYIHSQRQNFFTENIEKVCSLIMERVGFLTSLSPWKRWVNYCGKKWCQEKNISLAFSIPPLLLVQTSRKLVVSNLSWLRHEG